MSAQSWPNSSASSAAKQVCRSLPSHHQPEHAAIDHFTPLAALCGGALIGLAASLLWLGIGRVAGISGIAGSLLAAHAEGRAWRIAFLAGLIAAPVLITVARGHTPPIHPSSPLLVMALGGLLVGIGTTLAGGCTSGHGVCGAARLSPRSLTATVLFMAAAIATVFTTRHLLWL